MSYHQVWQLYREGKDIADIASQTHLKQRQVEEIIREELDKRIRNRVIFAGVASLMFATVFFLSLSKQFNFFGRSSGIDSSTRLQIVSQNKTHFLKKAPKDRWQVNKGQLAEANFDFLISLRNQVKTMVESALSENESIPEVEKEKKFFSGNLVVSYYYQGATMIPFAGNNQETLGNHLEIVLVADGYQTEPRIKKALSLYDNQWRAVLISAVEMSIPWFNSLITHQLFHAWMDRSQSAKSSTYNQSWDEEELKAFEIERKVLGLQTQGRYLAKIYSVLKRIGEPDTLADFYAKVSLEDLQSLDSLFPQATYLERGMRLSKFYFDLSDSWLIGKYSGEELQKKRIENYRFFLSNI